MENVPSQTQIAIWAGASLLTAGVTYMYPDLLLNPKTNSFGVGMAFAVNGVALTFFHSYITEYFETEEEVAFEETPLQKLEREFDALGRKTAHAAEDFEKAKKAKETFTAQLDDEIATQKAAKESAESTRDQLAGKKAQAKVNYEQANDELGARKKACKEKRAEVEGQEKIEEQARETFERSQDELAIAKEQIEKAEGRLGRLSRGLERLETQQQEAIERFQAMQENALQASEKLRAATAKHEALQKAVQENQASLQTLKPQLAAVAQKAEKFQKAHSEASQKREAAQANLRAAEHYRKKAEIDEKRQELRQLASVSHTLKARKGTLSGVLSRSLNSQKDKSEELGRHQGSIESHRNELSIHTSRLQVLSSELAGLKQTLNILNKIKPFKDNLTELEKSYRELFSKFQKRSDASLDIDAELKTIVLDDEELDQLVGFDRYHTRGALGHFVRGETEWEEKLKTLEPLKQLKVYSLNIEVIKGKIAVLKEPQSGALLGTSIPDDLLNNIHESKQSLNLRWGKVYEEMQKINLNKLPPLKRNIDDLKPKIEDMEKELRNLTSEVEGNQRSLKSLNGEIASNESSRETLTAEIQQYEDSLTALRDALEGEKEKEKACKAAAESTSRKLEQLSKLIAKAEQQIRIDERTLQTIQLKALEEEALHAFDEEKRAQETLRTTRENIETAQREIASREREIARGKRKLEEEQQEQASVHQLAYELDQQNTADMKRELAQIEQLHREQLLKTSQQKSRFEGLSAQWEAARDAAQRALETYDNLTGNKTELLREYNERHDTNQWEELQTATKEAIVDRKASILQIEESDLLHYEYQSIECEIEMYDAQLSVILQEKSGEKDELNIKKYEVQKATRVYLESKIEFLEKKRLFLEHQYLTYPKAPEDYYSEWKRCKLELKCFRERLFRHENILEWSPADILQSLTIEQTWQEALSELRYSSHKAQLIEGKWKFTLKDPEGKDKELLIEKTIILLETLIEKSVYIDKIDIFEELRKFCVQQEQPINALRRFFGNNNADTPFSRLKTQAERAKERRTLLNKGENPHDSALPYDFILETLYHFLDAHSSEYRKAKHLVLDTQLKFLQEKQFVKDKRRELEAKEDVVKAQLKSLESEKSAIKKLIDPERDEEIEPISYWERFKEIAIPSIPEMAIFTLYYSRIPEKIFGVINANISWFSGCKVSLWTFYIHKNALYFKDEDKELLT